MDLGAQLMKPRVLILTGEPANVPGGMEHVVGELESGLRVAGFSVEVLHRENSAPEWVSRPRNRWMSYLADIALSWFLGLKVRKLRGADLVAVISNGPFGWYLPRLSGSVRRVHFYHGTYRGQVEMIRPFIGLAGALKLKWWDSMILERESGRGKQIICNSDQTRKEINDYFGYRGETVWLPLDTIHFAPRDKIESRRKLGLPESAKIGLFVGSCASTKGFSTLQYLIKNIPDIHWCLALRGSLTDEVTTSQNLSIFQNAGKEILPWLYNAADFVVSPSLYESFGYVVAEALACGVPVVASPSGAGCAFLRHSPLEHLLVENVHSWQDYSVAIHKVLENTEKYQSVVEESIRPEIEKKMGLDNWLNHFRKVTAI
jgi:glycosyltransferase involved in cell wall biosynthesis